MEQKLRTLQLAVATSLSECVDLGGVERPASRKWLWILTRKIADPNARVQGLPVKQRIALLQTSHQMARLYEETKSENKCPGQSFQDLSRTLTVLSESL